jgi:hypothetical protein
MIYLFPFVLTAENRITGPGTDPAEAGQNEQNLHPSSGSTTIWAYLLYMPLSLPEIQNMKFSSAPLNPVKQFALLF